MTITQQQTFNPPFSNPDDMPEYVSIYEMKPKRKSGRPKSSLTDEERAQKKKDAYKIWYHNNWEYRTLKQRIYYENNRERENERRLALYHRNKKKANVAV